MSIRGHHVRSHNRRIRGKRNYTTLWAVLFIVVLWYSLIGKELLPEVLRRSEMRSIEEESNVYGVPCTEANMAKQLACTLDGHDAKATEKTKDQEGEAKET